MKQEGTLYPQSNHVCQCRSELHLHTKTSDEVSVIGVNEIFAKAAALGLRAIAFTNLHSVHDFAQIARCAKAYEHIHTIYGAEVAYKSPADDAVYRLTMLAKNDAGIKALYKVLSSARGTDTTRIIDRQALADNRQHLLVGSCGNNGELYALVRQHRETRTVHGLYDYFELFPSDEAATRETNKAIFELGESLGIPVVAASNAHYLAAKDAVCCRIVHAVRGEQAADELGRYTLRNTQEMLEEFAYLGERGARKTVLENPQIIADGIQRAEPPQLHAPLHKPATFRALPDAAKQLRQRCKESAARLYGEPLPAMVQQRMDEEWPWLNDERTATQFLLAKRLTDLAKGNHAPTCSRGMVGSVFAAFLLGISEINPLPAHYYCPTCRRFEEAAHIAADGFDLPAKACPACGQSMRRDGHHIPHETFAGLAGEKRSEIDLVFTPSFRSVVVNHLKETFGADTVARAGTTLLITKWQAERYVAHYEKESGCPFAQERREEIVDMLCGVKRYSSFPTAAYMILPDGYAFEDFTPLDNRDDTDGIERTTHVEFHALLNVMLKANVFCLPWLEQLSKLEKATGVAARTIPLDDPRVYALFSGDDVEGLPDFDNEIVANVMRLLQPRNFCELVKGIGMLHGTNVWSENGEYLLADGVPLAALPATRDDIFNDIARVSDRETAYRYSEGIRKNFFEKGKFTEEDTARFAEITRPLGDWYVAYCTNIRYMFPKAHAAEYALATLRLAWFKKYYPEQFRDVLAEKA